jgi:hypothetical protein
MLHHARPEFGAASGETARLKSVSVSSKINGLGRNSVDFNEESIVLARFARVLRL